MSTTVVPAAAIALLGSLAIVGLSSAEHHRSVRPSTLLITYLLLSAAFDAVQIRTFFLIADVRLGVILSVSLVIKLTILVCESTDKRSLLREPYKSYPPEAIVGVINRSLFWWLNRLFRAGLGKILTTDDLFALDPDLRSSILSEQIIRCWDSRGSLNCFNAYLHVTYYDRHTNH